MHLSPETSHEDFTSTLNSTTYHREFMGKSGAHGDAELNQRNRGQGSND
jgi:hypothetical protein